MKKTFLALLIILFVVACSSDWSKKPAPGCNHVTSQAVR